MNDNSTSYGPSDLIQAAIIDSENYYDQERSVMQISLMNLLPKVNQI